MWEKDLSHYRGLPPIHPGWCLNSKYKGWEPTAPLIRHISYSNIINTPILPGDTVFGPTLLIITSETEAAIRSMKNGKAPGMGWGRTAYNAVQQDHWQGGITRSLVNQHHFTDLKQQGRVLSVPVWTIASYATYAYYAMQWRYLNVFSTIIFEALWPLTLTNVILKRIQDNWHHTHSLPYSWNNIRKSTNPSTSSS